MKRIIVVIITAIMLVSVWVPVLSTRSASALSTATYDAGVNQAIVSKASCQLGQYGGQCKAWVQQLVYNASGRHLFDYCSADSYWPKRWLPLNLPSGTGWYPASFVVPVVSGTSGLSAKWWLMKPGHIIQFTHSALAGRVTPHTVIVKQNLSTGLWVIDCNWGSDGVVREHFITKAWLDTHSRGYAAYQIR